MDFTRHRVEDAWIDVDGTIIPVARFKASFRINELPTAQVVPAIGRDLTTGNLSTLEDLQEEMPAELYLQIDGEVKLILKGYIANITASDNATTFNQTVTANITIIHRAVKLAGSPGLSYIYSSANTATLASLEDRRTQYDPVTGQPVINRTQPFFTWGKSGGPNSSSVLYPSSFLKNITTELFNNNSTETLPEDLIKDYDPANLTPIGITSIDPTGITYALYQQFIQNWEQRNALEGLKAACNMMYLHLIYYNEGFYIANPNSLINTPAINILSDDYTSITHSRSGNFQTRVDGVVLRHPFSKLKGASSDGAIWAVYPKAREAIAGEPGDEVPTPNQYYHYATCPKWLQGTTSAHWADTPVKVNRGKAKGMAQMNKREEPLTEYYNRVGVRIAKAIYADMVSAKSPVTVTMPYRIDLMPGTMVSIENSDTLGVKFMGDIVYGMIEEMELECSVITASPHIGTSIRVIATRTEEDNQEPPVGYGLSEHPIYEDIWVGTDLCGDLLADVPASATPPNTGSGSNNANSGGGASRSGNTNNPSVRDVVGGVIGISMDDLIGE